MHKYEHFCHTGVSEQLPYLKSLGVGVLILEGQNLTQNDRDLGALPQFRQLMIESGKAGRLTIFSFLFIF